ncbi:sialic acid-binding Ig-like lectin 5, partial [Lampris incognitus]|uniref:sialic acid-binding Ig-like lectin 5 n=1 Tax=Lampris incognitus TaxID=2546036 RepID=UPI0024B50C63
MLVFIWANLLFFLSGNIRGANSSTSPALSQKPTVKAHPLMEGRETSLTCTAPALCAGTPPKIIWTWRGKGEHVSHIPSTIISNFTKYPTFGTQRHRSMVNFTPSAEHHGTEVTCRVNFTDNISSEETVTLNVTFRPTILNGSECVLQSGALTCLCISQGVPLPSIKWPLLEKSSEYIITTSLSSIQRFTISETISLPLKDQDTTTVECFSSNQVGDMRKDLTVTKTPPLKQQDQHCGVLSNIIKLKITLILLNGMILSATIGYLRPVPPLLRYADYHPTSRSLHQRRSFTGICFVIFGGNTVTVDPAGRGFRFDGAVETETQEQCRDGFCITLSKDTIKAVAGLCVVVPCSFTPKPGFKTDRMIWKYNRKVVFHSTRPGDVSAGFKGRTTLLEPNITGRRCSFIISDLTQSDSGSYQFRIEGSNGFTFPFDTRVTVSALSQKPTVKAHPLMEGRETSLTCTAPALCAGTPPKIIWTWRGKGEHVSHIPSTIISNFTKYPTFGTQRHRSMVNFTPSAEHHGTEVTCRVNFTDNISSEETVTLNVTYLKDPRITGNTVVAEGDALNLTCSVDSYPPSHITWTTAEPDKRPQAGRGNASLIIPAVKREHSGRYTCTAEHLNKSLTASVEVTLMVRPTILNGSECVLQSGALTCLCISQGVPLPSIKWPLLEKSSEYIITTSLSSIQRFTINETISLPLKDQDTTTVECFSSNQVGDMRKDLTVTKTPPLKQQDRHEESPLSIIKLEIILAFLSGVVLSATICYLTTTCLRSQKRNCRSLPESAEMMT